MIAEIPEQRPFQGDDYFDNVGWGESIYGPVTTQLLRVESNTRPEDMAQMRRIALALAKQGLYVNSHVEMHAAIDAFLKQKYEAINKVHPIPGIAPGRSRHLDQVDEEQLGRMKRLGMYAQIHSRPLIQGALMHKVHGDKASNMPPFRRVQDSGIPWGLGSDATAVTTSNPFYTLSLAVTGEMIGGRKVNRQTITREEALIAHTRSNASFLFREGDLGSLARGKYADLLVLDRDYLTVPAAEIKDIKPLMTMVGGKIVHDIPDRSETRRRTCAGHAAEVALTERLLDHVERVRELAELHDPPVTHAHEVCDVEAKQPPGRALLESHIRHHRSPVVLGVLLGTRLIESPFPMLPVPRAHGRPVRWPANGSSAWARR